MGKSLGAGGGATDQLTQTETHVLLDKVPASQVMLVIFSLQPSVSLAAFRQHKVPIAAASPVRLLACSQH